MHIADSERLSYRLMDENDAELLFELDQDPEVMRHLTGGKISSMEKILTVFLPRMNSYRTPDKGWGLWQVNIKESDEYIGWILVRPMAFFTDNPAFDNLELGWRFMQKSWGKGYAFEAANTVKSALAHDASIKAFSALAVKENIGSIAVMKKLGMSFVKEYLHKDPLGDSQAVHYQMDI